jgi:hypothetical protein
MPTVTLEPRVIHYWLDGIKLKVKRADFSKMAQKWKTRLSLSAPSKASSDEEESLSGRERKHADEAIKKAEDGHTLL